jgi:hypothetical protein
LLGLEDEDEQQQPTRRGLLLIHQPMNALRDGEVGKWRKTHRKNYLFLGFKFTNWFCPHFCGQKEKCGIGQSYFKEFCLIESTW